MAKSEMERRDSMTPHRLHVLSDVTAKTINKICAGGKVYPSRLTKIVRGLSAEGPAVRESDIPNDN